MRGLVRWLASGATVTAFASCTGSGESAWATNANEVCSGLSTSWSSVAVDDVDKETLRSDLRQLARELAAIDGGNGDARRAVEGMETFVAAMDAGEAPTDIEWIAAFRDAGAESCWQVFQGSSSAAG